MKKDKCLRKLQEIKFGNEKIYYSICIPKHLIHIVKWKKGDFIRIKIVDGQCLEMRLDKNIDEWYNIKD